ncbi:hypothetical protein CspeluHIS016_0107900 [Cutaneotrichosporon spelunceum]|uniref:Coronin n=1 Tax=Cutaneotrichosporon spelunceum TaxID=1672016 RepID=A0AAD3Y9Z9_9TREE|nr:hypothetical protein CspeluHIS016_0107900 [Cutaneotrichosporon spelunceum]
MSRFVRPSSYRHVYGQPSKVHYENVKISGSAWDTNMVTVGGKYMAVNWQVSGGGAFAIFPTFSPYALPEPSGFPTKLPDILPLARGHSGPVLDTAWSPFDDNLVVSSGEDGKIFIWKVDDSAFAGWGEEKWEPEDFAPVGKLNAGGRKVGHVEFHPTASNVLSSASGDHLVRVWDIEGSPDQATISLAGHKDSVQSIAWNSVGTTLATTCRDRKLRIFDPRAGADAVRVAEGHGGIKGSRVVWLGDRDRLATTGFSRMSDRQLMLWETAGLTQLQTESLDSSAGIIIPYFADGNDVLFLAGKGDGNIRYFEFEGDHFHFLNEYKTSDPQRGIGFLPRRALDVSQNEIARAFKLSGRDVTPLSFIVPRKAEGFQSDIFPPANSAEPALKADEWFAGKNARPNVIDLETRVTSANKAPLSTPKPTAPSTPKQSSPKPEKQSKLREEVKPLPKEEPKPAPKAVTPPKAATPPPKEEPKKEPDVKTRDLEIEQPDSSEDEAAPKAALGAASVVAGGAALGAAAMAAKPAPGVVPSPSPSGMQNTTDQLLIKFLNEGATLPTRGSPLSAGHDLYAADGIIIPARGKALVSTGLAIAVPKGTYGRIAPRSGLASKHSIDVGAGVVDADYRGEVKVLLFNYGGDDFKVAKGDRVAQLILEHVHMAPVRQVDDLEATLRGAGGFGSTGGFA